LDPSWELSDEIIEKIRAKPGGVSIIELVSGKAEVIRRGESEWAPAGEKTILLPGDSIRTGPGSYVRLIHRQVLHKGDEPHIAQDIQEREISERIAENREFVERWGNTVGMIYGMFFDWRDYEVEEYKQDTQFIEENTELCIGTNFNPEERGFIDVIGGAVRVFLEGDRGQGIFSVKAGTTVCGIRGSDVLIDYDPVSDKVDAYVIEGHMDVTRTETGEMKSLTNNQKLIVENGVIGEIQPLSQAEWDTLIREKGLDFSSDEIVVTPDAISDSAGVPTLYNEDEGESGGTNLTAILIGVIILSVITLLAFKKMRK
jgi:hypothetical protein